MSKNSANRNKIDRGGMQGQNVHMRNRKATTPNTSIEEQRIFVGPIPPAEEMSAFKGIDPSFPERILKLAEDEAAFRREEQRKNNKVIRAEIRSDGVIRFVAPFMAFILACAMLYLAYFAFTKGLEWAGTIISLPSLGGLIYAFYSFTKTRRNS